MNNLHSGRISQALIYTGKLFRLFIFKNDWKVLPMAAVIAALVAYVMGERIFNNMAGTLLGSFGFTCICVWNGCFNSIQAVCRERPIVKREHRSGLHMSSYILAHMTYQAFICICQSVIIVAVMHIANIRFPAVSHMTGNVNIDFLVTFFLITYASDMTALFISSVVRNTTTAMTIMPFVMIFELVFSGGLFALPSASEGLTDFAISKWGLNSLCSIGEYNTLPNDAIIGALDKMDISRLSDEPITDEDMGESDITLTESAQIMKEYLEDPDTRARFMVKCGLMAYKEDFASTADNILTCWLNMLGSVILFPILSVISLEFIDKDKR